MAEIFPAIDECENYRKVQLTILIICLILTVLAFALFIVPLYIFDIPKDFIRVIPFVLIIITIVSALVSTSILSEFSIKLKDKFGASILSLLDNVSFSDRSFSVEELEKSSLFTTFNNIRSKDSFIYTINNSEVFVSELSLENVTKSRKAGTNTSTVFQGAIISIPVNKKFNSHTIIECKVPSGKTILEIGLKVISVLLLIGALVSLLIYRDSNNCIDFLFFSVISFFLSRVFRTKKNFDKVKLDETQLTKMFNIYADTSLAEAFCFITPDFIQGFKNLKNVFGNKQIKYVFFENKIIITIATGQNLFEIGSIFETLKNPVAFYKFYSQISAILDMVEHLKMCDETLNNR